MLESFVSTPAGLGVPHEKLRRLRPGLYGVRGALHRLWSLLFTYSDIFNMPHQRFIRGQLQSGESAAAVVVQINPLLVAAYSRELDCVAMLKLPDEAVEEHDLREGDRLVCVNGYERKLQYQTDLIPGPGELKRYTGFHPILAELISDDRPRLDELRQQISEKEWSRAAELGREYLEAKPGRVRDGRPAKSAMPLGSLRNGILLAIVLVVLVTGGIWLVLEFLDGR